jgi:hypothetical protein
MPDEALLPASSGVGNPNFSLPPYTIGKFLFSRGDYH